MMPPILNTIGFIASHPVNRSRPLRALLRYLRWQVGSRLVGGPVVHRWIGEARFIVGPGETGLTGNIYCGLHEFHDMGFLLHFLRRDDLFVDVGANVGSYSILAGAVAGARAVAFEPVPDTYRRLVRNIRINDLEPRVQCVNQAVGDVLGRLSFTAGQDTANHALAPGETCADAVEVEITTLDAALGQASPTLLKIDVEGFESAVLTGGRRVLEQTQLRALILELNGSGRRYGREDADIVETLRGLGFACFAYDPMVRTLASIDTAAVETSGNVLFVRDPEFVLERVRAAPPIEVLGHRL